jgi:serine/threonine protein kinase
VDVRSTFSFDILYCNSSLPFLCLLSELPFYDTTELGITKQICYRAVDFSGNAWKEVSENAKDLISRLLEKDQTKRLTADQALAHAWMQEKEAALKGRKLTTGLQELRKFQARKKFRAGIQAVKMVGRAKKVMALSTIREESSQVGNHDDF